MGQRQPPGLLLQINGATLTGPVHIGARKARAVLISHETLEALGIELEYPSGEE